MSGTCVVLISDDAQRTMLTCLGVSSEIEKDDIDAKLLEGSEYIYLEGYLFDSAMATETMHTQSALPNAQESRSRSQPRTPFVSSATAICF